MLALEHVTRDLDAVDESFFGIDVADVVLDGSDAQVQFGGNLFVAVLVQIGVTGTLKQMADSISSSSQYRFPHLCCSASASIELCGIKLSFPDLMC